MRSITYYWAADPTDNAFMEVVTERDDVGTDLQAPRLGRGGQLPASYRLVQEATPGSVVVHYDSRQEAIVGVSVAAGAPEPAPTFWRARGTSARRAGVEHAWLPGVRVPLTGWTPMAPPVTLAELRELEPQLMAIRDELQRRHGPQTRLYFPWVPYARGAQPMRTFQTYLAKLPAAVLDLVPRLRHAVDAARASAMPPASEVDQVEAAVAEAAGQRARTRRGGQGFQLEPAVRVAVEAHAMNVATDYFLDEGWEVVDVHGKESYDLRCLGDGAEKHVEVKGTTTEGVEVILTPNEVAHARDHPEVALFVLARISVERTDDGAVHAWGGSPIVLDQWEIDAGVLRPVGFRYQLPSHGHTDRDEARARIGHRCSPTAGPGRAPPDTQHGP